MRNEEIEQILNKYNYNLKEYKDEIEIKVASFLQTLSSNKNYFTYEELDYPFTENCCLDNLWYDNYSKFVDTEEEYYADMEKLDDYRLDYYYAYLKESYNIEYDKNIGMFDTCQYFKTQKIVEPKI